MPETWFEWQAGPMPAALNMAWDETLLENVASSGVPILRTYGWTEAAATFGYFQAYDQIAAWTPLRPLIRRPTGGGLVQHDRDWTYCLAVPPGHWWYELKAAESYKHVHEWLRLSFAELGLETSLAPAPDPAGPGQCFIGAETSDLLCRGRKIAGAAQRRNKLGLLIQGSVQTAPEKLSRADWEKSLRTSGAKLHRTSWQPLRFEELQRRASQLAGEKYLAKAYNERR